MKAGAEMSPPEIHRMVKGKTDNPGSTFVEMERPELHHKLCKVSETNVKICIFWVNASPPTQAGYLFKHVTNQQN